MNESKELRLVQAIFLFVPIATASEANAVYEFAQILAVDTVQAVRDVGESHDVQPEAVGRYVAERCNRYMSEEAIEAVISEAIAATTGVGAIAQTYFEIAQGALGIDETPTPQEPQSPLQAPNESARSKVKIAAGKAKLAAGKAKIATTEALGSKGR